MPNAPLRPCAEPRCPILVPKGRCAQHAKAQDRQRGTSFQRGYDAAWARYSRAFREQHPLCGERADGSMDSVHSRCVQQGLTTPAQCVDHTVPMSQGGSKWDQNNHMSACDACNSWKANTLDAGGYGGLNP
jgi:5-methylcytosine-specific restriction protein A